MLIYPTLHYQNGGLELQQTGETRVPGLFVAGEVGGGIHGANRLMANSLLDIIVFGHIAGTSASNFVADGVKDSAIPRLMFVLTAKANAIAFPLGRQIVRCRSCGV
jgi:succinate dehydrogenase/fumarate reductase flavoprotein subunit